MLFRSPCEKCDLKFKNQEELMQHLQITHFKDLPYDCKECGENFLRSMLISCFSFTEVAKEASKLMNKGGSMLTLTYESNKAIPNYNVMGVCKSALESSVKYLARDLGSKGIRVNAISAGPIKTLAASAIGDAKFLYKWFRIC